MCERFPQTPLRHWTIVGWIDDPLDLTHFNSVLEWALNTMARKLIYMLMLLLALAGGASFVMRRHKTNLALRSSSWVMEKSFSLTALMDQNGSFAQPAKCPIISPVSPPIQSNRLNLKAGHLSAPLISAMPGHIKWVTHTKKTRSANRVTKPKVGHQAGHFNQTYSWQKNGKIEVFEEGGREAKCWRPLKKRDWPPVTRVRRTNNGRWPKWRRLRLCGKQMMIFLLKRSCLWGP